MSADAPLSTLQGVLRQGWSRRPSSWDLTGPVATGLLWLTDDGAEVVGTPALVRLAAALPTEGETTGALLATEPRYRGPWLRLEAARLLELGARDALSDLVGAIDAAGPAAAVLHTHLADGKLGPTGMGALELSLFGGAADQPMAALSARRALSATAPLIEGELGAPHSVLPDLDPEDPSVSWCAGRLLQRPSQVTAHESRAVLSGRVPQREGDRMRWVLDTPWITLLAALVFTAEAWAAERRGGVVLELPLTSVQSFQAPPRVDIVVTLPDGQEVLCGSLGELCLRVVDALGMAVVPPMGAAALDQALAPVIARLLTEGVWVWQPDARPRYAISDGFSFDCYRGLGHRAIYLAGESLSHTIRGVCLTWARARLGVAA